MTEYIRRDDSASTSKTLSTGAISARAMAAVRGPSMLEVAIRYATFGIPVIPLREAPGRNMRAPYTQNGKDDATTDLDTIRGWWRKWPNALVAIVPTGELVVVDVDDTPSKSGKVRNGSKNLEKLGITLPETPLWQISGGGGRHLWYRKPSGCGKIPKKTCTDVDVYADGIGYIVVAPSLHWSGNRHAWGGEPLDGPIADALHLLPELPEGFTVDRTPKREAHSRKFGAHVFIDLDNHRLIDASFETSPPIDRLKRMLDAVPVPDGDDRQYWLEVVGAPLHHYSGGDEWGFSLWKYWSKIGDNRTKWDDDYSRDKWDSFGNYRGSPRTIGTLIKLAKENGWRGRVEDKVRLPIDDPDPNAMHDDGTVTESNVAATFVREHRNNFRYVVASNKKDHGYWLRWEGTHWASVPPGDVRNVINRIAIERAAASDAAPPERRRAASRSFITGAESLARDNPALRIAQNELNGNPLMIATPDGVVDLRTGTLRRARPDDLITTLFPTAPDNDKPVKWLKFLEEATGDDPDTIRTLQQYLGLCLTRTNPIQKAMFIHGRSGTGKSVLSEVLQALFGDAHASANSMTLCRVQGNRHPADVAALAGTLLVTLSEFNANEVWDQERFTSLTGDTSVVARAMHADPTKISVSFKLLMFGNQIPKLPALDGAIQRRLIIVPFDRKPKEENLNLVNELIKERGQILKWLIDGYLDLMKSGGKLYISPKVEKRTKEYFKGEDELQAWLDECCTKRRPSRVRQRNVLAEALFASYRLWCEENVGNKPRYTTRASFIHALEFMGFTKSMSHGKPTIAGLSLLNSRSIARVVR